jgi:hypothetical protein
LSRVHGQFECFQRGIAGSQSRFCELGAQSRLVSEDCELEDVGCRRSDAVLGEKIVGEEEREYGRELREKESS